MITEEFEGYTRMRSRYLTGSLFQSSFCLQEPKMVNNVSDENDVKDK